MMPTQLFAIQHKLLLNMCFRFMRVRHNRCLIIYDYVCRFVFEKHRLEVRLVPHVNFVV